jgi:hypothetical protein
MTAKSISRLVLALLALVLVGGVVFAVQYARREAPAESVAALTSPVVPNPAPEKREQSAALAKAKSETNAVVDALIGKPLAAENNDGVPTFDVARIEPSGEAVIAGRAAPGATVELLRDGEVHDRVVADASGQFVMTPSRLPAGTYDLTLRAKQADGKQATSKQRVTAVLEPKSTDKPVVALLTPDKPTVVLSQPGAPKAASGTVVVETVEIERTGKFHGRCGRAFRRYHQ